MDFALGGAAVAQAAGDRRQLLCDSAKFSRRRKRAGPVFAMPRQRGVGLCGQGLLLLALIFQLLLQRLEPAAGIVVQQGGEKCLPGTELAGACLLYTSDAADEVRRV